MIQEDNSQQKVQQEQTIKNEIIPSQVDQNQQIDQLPENIKNFIILAKEAKDKAEILNNYDENQKIVFLIGNTRAGKSTLFHLLKGDELVPHDYEKLDIKVQLPSQIGHGGMAETKILNIFENDNKIVIVDTPGLHDTNDGYQEIVSQLNLQREMNKFKNIYILVVAYYDTRSNNELQDILRVAQKLFHNKDHFDKLKDRMRLVITQSTMDKYSMVGKMEKIFKEILDKNPNYKGKDILEHFSQNSSKILFFKKIANSNEQNQLREEIEQFIKQIGNQQLEQSDQVQNQQIEQGYQDQNLQDQNFQLIISDKGQINTEKFLKELTKFYQLKLTSVLNKINFLLENSNDIDSNFSICQLIYNLNDKLNLYNVIQFQTELYQILEKYQFDQCIDKELKCIDKELNQVNVLFHQDYIKQILEIYEINDNSEIQIQEAFGSFKKTAQKIAISFQELQQSNSKEWLQYFNSMFEAYQKFIKLEDWKKLIIIVGNRLSGKSKALNLLYEQKQKKFTENYMENNLNQNQNQQESQNQNQQENQKAIINYIDMDFVSLQQINQDLVIEIKELQVEFLPFLEFFFKTAIDRNSLFVIGLVLNGTERVEDKVFQALNHFIESNQFDHLKIIKNYKNRNLINQIEWIQLIPNLKQLNFDLQITCCQIVENQENSQIQNIEIFNDEKLKQIKNYNKKHQLIGLGWWLEQLNQYFTEFYKIAFQDFYLWDFSKLPIMKNLILLSELNPDDDKDKFNQKLEEILKIYRPEISIKVPGKKFQTMQNLFKYLTEKENLRNIKSAIQETKDIKERLEQLFKMFQISQEPPVYNIIPKAKTLCIIKQFFPKLLESKLKDEKSGLEEKLVCIQRIINDIYQFDNKESSVIQKIAIKKDISYNVAVNLSKEVDGVHKQFQKLLSLIIDAQYRDFVLNDEYFITRWPKKIYREIISVFDDKQIKKVQKVFEFQL